MKALWRLLRAYGDAKAISRGPKAIGRRVTRRAAHRTLNRLLRKGF